MAHKIIDLNLYRKGKEIPKDADYKVFYTKSVPVKVWENNGTYLIEEASGKQRIVSAEELFRNYVPFWAD